MTSGRDPAESLWVLTPIVLPAVFLFVVNAYVDHPPNGWIIFGIVVLLFSAPAFLLGRLSDRYNAPARKAAEARQREFIAAGEREAQAKRHRIAEAKRTRLDKQIAAVEAARITKIAASEAAQRVMNATADELGLAGSSAEHFFIQTWREAEKFVAVWMALTGFADVQLTTAGADMGVDVQGEGVIAQVKFQKSVVGRQVVQQLYGESQRRTSQALFFTSSSYANTAVEFASGHVALFTYTISGQVTAVNAAAKRLSAKLARQHGRAASTLLVAEAIAMPDPPPPVRQSTPRRTPPRSRSRTTNRRRPW